MHLPVMRVRNRMQSGRACSQPSARDIMWHATVFVFVNVIQDEALYIMHELLPQVTVDSNRSCTHCCLLQLSRARTDDGKMTQG